MKKKLILVICDNFLIGGRETYIETCLSELQHYNNAEDDSSYSACLLVNQVESTVVENIFTSVASVESKGDDLLNWLEVGSCLIEKQKPEFIWVHHYALLPAFLLACEHQLPLVVSLHGAPFGMGGFNSTSDLLGLGLIIQEKITIAAVSKEIRDQLISVEVEPSGIELTPNCVKLDRQSAKEKSLEQYQRDDLESILMTRPQKLSHIRAAVKLCAKLNRQKVPTNLTIYTGRRLQSSSHGVMSKTIFLGRKWLFKNPLIFCYLHRIKFEPPTCDPDNIIVNSDIVFGMGRVVLEGIAARKPTVLIGYEQTKGLVTKANFTEFQYSNFSGRGIKQKNVSQIVYEITEYFSASVEKQHFFAEQLNSISVQSCCQTLRKIFKALPLVAPHYKGTIAAFKRREFNQDVFIEMLSRDLSNDKQKMLQRFPKSSHL